ncbi:MAG: tetratricopeptide repeat protein, partial [Ignavibacteria bacterium]|nr:tetratricopeptide repeat protein [Ignavibacteria bacterium]
NGVTYLAFLREWYRVANQDALFTTINLPPEVMEVYKYTPGKTKILSREVNGLLMKAQTLVGKKDAQQLLFIINRVIALDPYCSQAYVLRAYAYSILNDNAGYETNMLKAAEIFPEYSDVYYYLGDFYKNQGRFEDAKQTFTKYLELYPGNPTITKSLAAVEDSLLARTPQMKFFK